MCRLQLQIQGSRVQFQELRTYHIVCVVILELLDVGVDEGFFITAFHAEFLLAGKSGGGE